MRLSLWIAVAGLTGIQVGAARSAEGVPPPVPGPVVVLQTTAGDIQIELDPVHAPLTVTNFLRYVKAGYYSGTVFHRVMAGFLIQGGGYTRDQKPKPAPYPPIPLEARNGLKHVRGSVAAARSAEPGSATSQFFINLVDNAVLDYPGPDGRGYAVFGKVIEGMEVVDRIGSAPVGPSRIASARDGTPEASYPATAIVLKEVKIVREGDDAAAPRKGRGR